MRQSQLFTKTTKTVAKDIKLTSHKLLTQGGFIRESSAGRYYFLPLGLKVRDKIVKIIEEEMDQAGSLKMITPVLHPLELWQETNRTEAAGFELMTVEDRRDSKFALGGTAEEMMVDLVRDLNISYRDLPFSVYQFSQKFRDELRARGGLLRVREFLMKDAYSFHVDEKDFCREYQKMWKTYQNIFKRLGLKTVVVEADNGYIGGDYSHEFIVECEAGESNYLVSEDEQYAAHEDVAKFKKVAKNLDETEAELKEVSVSRGKTMKDGVEYHKLPLWQQLKDVMFVDDQDRFILAVIRGDLTVNELKLTKLIEANNLRPATEEEIRKLGSEPGFISPVAIDKQVIVVGDDSLRTIKNAYGGANKKDTDYLNVNIDRDYKVKIEGDIALARAGEVTIEDQKLIAKKGIEVGNIFQLGYHYSKKMKAQFTNQQGQEKYYYMGCYGIGVGRNLATIVEKHSDERGIIWPAAVAPFQVHLVPISMKDEKVVQETEKLYKSLQEGGIEVLYDDREGKRTGEQLADVDLIGIPWRVIISPKTLEKSSCEVKRRSSDETELIVLEKVLSYLEGELGNKTK